METYPEREPEPLKHEGLASTKQKARNQNGAQQEQSAAFNVNSPFIQPQEEPPKK